MSSTWRQVTGWLWRLRSAKRLTMPIDFAVRLIDHSHVFASSEHVSEHVSCPGTAGEHFYCNSFPQVACIISLHTAVPTLPRLGGHREAPSVSRYRRLPRHSSWIHQSEPKSKSLPRCRPPVYCLANGLKGRGGGNPETGNVCVPAFGGGDGTASPLSQHGSQHGCHRRNQPTLSARGRGVPVTQPIRVRERRRAPARRDRRWRGRGCA
jgi:hypothetical protein